MFHNLKQYVPVLKSRLFPEGEFGLGLRLAEVAAAELLQNDHLNDFKHWLAQEEGYVFTLNGFPYGGFHHQVVKDQVYALTRPRYRQIYKQ